MPTALGSFTPTVIKVPAAARAATAPVKVAAAVAAAGAVTKAVARHLGTVSLAKIVAAAPANNTLFSVVLTNSPLNNICGRQ
jgi:hypothetical protein